MSLDYSLGEKVLFFLPVRSLFATYGFKLK